MNQAKVGYDSKEPEAQEDINILEERARNNPNMVYADLTPGKSDTPVGNVLADRRGYLLTEEAHDADQVQLAQSLRRKGQDVDVPEHLTLPPLATQAPASTVAAQPAAATSNRPRTPTLPARPKL